MTGGGAKEGSDGWRLPAPEIERAITAGLVALLNDEAAIASAALESEIPAEKVPRFVQTARHRADLLQRENNPEALSSLVKRIDLKPGGVSISARLFDPNPDSDGDFPGELVVTRLLPMRIRKRGVEMRLVFDGSPEPARRDAVLLKAIARGRQWFEDLVSGKAESISAISRRERLAVRHVGRIIRLAFLSPDVVEAVLEGRQPPELTAQELILRRKLPLKWIEQRALLRGV